MKTENKEPTIPANKPYTIYNVPISLWLVEKNHLLIKLII